MSNLTITNNDIGGVVLNNAQYRNDALNFAGAATILAGTILARKAVDDAVVAAADGGNTGDGTVTLASVAAGAAVPLAGAYVLECIEAVANGGVFQLTDPNGSIVSGYLAMTAGAGASTVFETGGLLFTVTDGATDFIVGDKFTLTVAANGKLVPFEKDGAGGAQLPKTILTYEVTATGAGDVPVRVAVLGEYRKNTLVIDSDGDDSNIDAVVVEQLRDYGLTPIDTTELNILDNQ